MTTVGMMESIQKFAKTCFQPLSFRQALPVAVPIRRHLHLALAELQVDEERALWLFGWDAEGNMTRAERLEPAP